MPGAENEIVILATTRSNTSRDLGFMNQPELLNVATSRQLMKLIIVGDVSDTFANGCKTSGKIYDFASHGNICGELKPLGSNNGVFEICLNKFQE